MEKTKKYKVTNNAKDVRKFRDSFLGKDILVEPKKFIFTNKPPKENGVWKVENIEKLEKKKQLNPKEVIQNGNKKNRK
ncbi:hypothetical protein LCGC14_2925780 [marine sediment metagenome]|uniref:Uncharacterized protein n=1 Tax=marine sediment metagenome TaxID=412755 RepID=A0A0F8XMI4_9ZZZZ